LPIVGESRGGDDPAPALRAQTAQPLNNMGVRQGVLDRSEEAVAAYRQVIDRYGDEPTLGVKHAVRRAVEALGPPIAAGS